MLVTGSQAVLACTIMNGWMLLTYEWKFWGRTMKKNIILKSLEICEYIIMQNIKLFLQKKKVS
jgi:hypothetical protein